MPFSIDFTGEPDEFLDDDQVTPSAIGEISIGDWRENFVSTLYEWDRRAYQAQWSHSLLRILSGEKKAALITEFLSLGTAPKLEWWPLYRDGNIVHIQNHILWYETLPRDFDVTEAASFIKERETHNSDGNALSEWDVDLREIELFYKKRIPKGLSS